MESRKQAILDALGAFVRQRSGLDYRNYVSHGADVEGRRAYFREQRQITRDLHHYRELAAYVAMRDSITADALLGASRGAYSGRLTLDEKWLYEPMGGGDVRVDYCTGQYFPTEYRRAACAVLASAIWDYWRSECKPAPNSWRVESWIKLGEDRERSRPMQIHEACALLAEKGGQQYGHVQEYINGKSPGDWLRANARREFSRGIAAGYFQ